MKNDPFIAHSYYHTINLYLYSSNNSGAPPVKKARQPEGREARQFHQPPPQTTPAFVPPQQGYNYNQGQWGSYQAAVS